MSNSPRGNRIPKFALIFMLSIAGLLGVLFAVYSFLPLSWKLTGKWISADGEMEIFANGRISLNEMEMPFIVENGRLITSPGTDVETTFVVHELSLWRMKLTAKLRKGDAVSEWRRSF